MDFAEITRKVKEFIGTGGEGGGGGIIIVVFVDVISFIVKDGIDFRIDG